jgi:hypothetical protein
LPKRAKGLISQTVIPDSASNSKFISGYFHK